MGRGWSSVQDRTPRKRARRRQEPRRPPRMSAVRSWVLLFPAGHAARGLLAIDDVADAIDAFHQDSRLIGEDAVDGNEEGARNVEARQADLVLVGPGRGGKGLQGRLQGVVGREALDPSLGV